MKRVYSIIAIVVAVSVWCVMPAFAAKIDVGGDLRARGYYIQSEDFTEDGDANWLDARFRLDAKVQQGMTTGVIQVDLLRNSGGPTDPHNGNLVLGNSTGQSYNLLGVRQAYLAVNFPALTLIGGRYEVKLGNGLVLNDTTDFVAVSAPIGPVNLLVGYLILGEDDAPSAVSAANPSGDDTAVAANVGLKNVGGSGWDLNLFGVSAHFQSVDPDNKLQVFGLTGNGQAGPVALNAEVDSFFGDVTSSAGYEGTNLLVGGSLPADSVGLPVGLSAAIIYATGQGSGSDVNINTIDGDFRASNILVRDDFNNYEGLTNIGTASGSNLGLQAIKVAAILPTVRLMNTDHTPEVGLVYAKTSEDDADGDNDLGTEIYLNTNCKFDQNLSGNVGIAFLSAGDALLAGASPEDQLKLEAMLAFNF